MIIANSGNTESAADGNILPPVHAEPESDNKADNALAAAIDASLQSNADEDTDAEAYAADDEMYQRMELLIEAVGEAAQLAEALTDRIASLHARASVIRKSSISHLLETLVHEHDGLSAALDDSDHQAKDAADAHKTAAENTSAEFNRGVEAMQTELQQYEAVNSASLQRLEQVIQQDIEAGVQKLVGDSEAKMNDWISKTNQAWAQSADQVNRHVLDVISRAGESIGSKQTEALQSAQEAVSRCLQLKDEVQAVARSVGEVIQVFSLAMRATRTGLNVTAGTLSDVVTVFQEIV